MITVGMRIHPDDAQGAARTQEAAGLYDEEQFLIEMVKSVHAVDQGKGEVVEGQLPGLSAR